MLIPFFKTDCAVAVHSRPTLNLKRATVSSSEALLQRYAAGDRSFTGLELDDVSHDFAGQTLDAADFSSTFIVASFRGTSLIGAKFDGANVKTCDFRGANLIGASFKGAAIDGAQFAGAKLGNAEFVGATEQGHVYGDNEVPSGYEV